MYTYTLLYIIYKCLSVWEIIEWTRNKPHVGISIRIFIDSTIFCQYYDSFKVYQNEGNALKAGNRWLLWLLFWNKALHLFFCFYWSVVDLQCFRCTAKWFIYIYVLFQILSVLGYSKYWIQFPSFSRSLLSVLL